MHSLNIYDFFKILFLFTAVATMVSILLTSLTSTSQEIFQVCRSHCAQSKALERADNLHRLSLLRDYLSQISHEELQTILKEINVTGLDIESLQNKLSNTSDINILLQALSQGNAIV